MASLSSSSSTVVPYGKTTIDWSAFLAYEPPKVGESLTTLDLKTVANILDDASTANAVNRLKALVDGVRRRAAGPPIPKGVHVFYVPEFDRGIRHRVVTVAYVYDQATSTAYFGACIYCYDGYSTFSRRTHRYTALYRLMKKPKSGVFKMPASPLPTDWRDLETRIRASLKEPKSKSAE